jgi:hypothetical protein
MHSSLTHMAAAAAIVFVVTGGSWSIYSRVAPSRLDSGFASDVVRPHAVTSGGFSGAGAMRTPQTLNGPTVEHPVTTAQQPEKQASKSIVRKPLHRGKKAAVKSATPLTK